MYITKCDTKGCEEKIQDLCPEIMEGGWCKVQIERLKLQPRDKTLHLCDQHTKQLFDLLKIPYENNKTQLLHKIKPVSQQLEDGRF